MKKLFILFSGMCLLLLTACSSDDSENTTAGETFSKVITYMPSLANYTTKRIQYYDVYNNIIADTLFDNTGAWTQRIVRTLSGNVKTTQRYNSLNVITLTTTEEYDSSGRLINLNNNYVTFTYNSDNTITASTTAGGAFFKFSKSSNGLINQRLEMSDNSTVGLNFNNMLPIEYLNDGAITGTFTYYPNAMPDNLSQSINEMNNTILRNYRLEHLPSTCNSYLKTWLGLNRYEREFNSGNYQTHSKSFSIDPNVTPNTEAITAESFYYYN